MHNIFGMDKNDTTRKDLVQWEIHHIKGFSVNSHVLKLNYISVLISSALDFKHIYLFIYFVGEVACLEVRVQIVVVCVHLRDQTPALRRTVQHLGHLVILSLSFLAHSK